jgi:hypothetical protein
LVGAPESRWAKKGLGVARDLVGEVLVLVVEIGKLFLEMRDLV